MALALGMDSGEGETTRPGDPPIDPLGSLLDDTQALVQDYRRALLDVYARLRAAHRDFLARSRAVEAELNRLQEQLPGSPAADSRLPIDSSAVGSGSRRALVLRQEQEWLAERLVLLAGAARRVQVVERQAELSATFLRADLSDGAGPEVLTEAAQLHALQAREDERRRLAREIHDGPAQTFVNVIVELGNCRRLLNFDLKRAETSLEQVEGDLRASLREVRQFVQDLQPGPVSDLGLAVALQQYLEDYSRRTGLAVRFDAQGALDLVPSAVGLGFFRIVQEALQNVRKHSRARQVTVTLTLHDGELVGVIRDDGVGFDLQAKRGERGHFGLTSMSERATLLRATLEIASTPGAGTEVRVVVPLGRE